LLDTPISVVLQLYVTDRTKRDRRESHLGERTSTLAGRDPHNYRRSAMRMLHAATIVGVLTVIGGALAADDATKAKPKVTIC
jgi:hypothetical protein